MLSLIPARLTADRCLSRSLDIEITAPLVPVPKQSTEQVKWYGQISTPLARLVDLAHNNCQAAAAFRFIRMPWLANVKDGLVLGDLRYDREPELGFAELVITSVRTEVDRTETRPSWLLTLRRERAFAELAEYRLAFDGVAFQRADVVELQVGALDIDGEVKRHGRSIYRALVVDATCLAGDRARQRGAGLSNDHLRILRAHLALGGQHPAACEVRPFRRWRLSRRSAGAGA
jgi:hypothetical protein